ncbi:IclR family transcriptional regulator [Neobacillus sp. NPDC093182]|uniref:IclR family transcriptional regulator n=1 Tax=Neobacillus sp. NPDC093182 TaxID=3364297 RepID=UPI00380872CF
MASDSNRTLENGLDMLFQFTEQKPVLSVKDIVAELDLPRSTAYRLLETLKNKKLIQESGPGRYRLGLSILQLAKVATVGMELVTLALSAMEELSKETDETVILTGLIDDRAICIDRIESTQPIKLTFERGRVQPLHVGASAKILLAFLDEDKQRDIIDKLWRNGMIVDRNEYKKRLSNIKEEGFAISNEEIDLGAWAVAVPIFGVSGNILAGITVAGPKFRIDNEKEKRIIDKLQLFADELNEKIKLMEIDSI